MTDESPRARGKRRSKLLPGLLGHREDEDEAELLRVKRPKKKLKRVVRLKPRARRHMYEAVGMPSVSEKDIEITKKIIETVAPVPGAQTSKKSDDTFACVECGMQVPKSADRCPNCDAHYLTGVSEGVIQELEHAERPFQDDALERIIDRKNVPVIHFDAESGTIRYLEEHGSEPEFTAECSHCGTVVEFDIDRCPICGAKFDSTDSGIVSLVADAVFDEGCEDEIDCPSCGEHVKVVKGRCPACMEMVHGSEDEDPDSKVEPVIRGDNVVFLHLDVESGELNYLQRLANRLGFEQLTVHLEGIGHEVFDKNWPGLSRV